jgi:hypothetical protein
VVANKKIVEALNRVSKQFIHGFTYNGHPVSVAAGRAVLDIIRRDRLVFRAKQLEPVMRRELSRLIEMDCIGDVRGSGLLWGVEFVADKQTKAAFSADFNFSGKVAAEAASRGVLVYSMQGTVDGYSGDHLLIAPPAIISEDHIAECASKLAESIAAVENSFHKSQFANHK